jgi:hypothetical protein
MNPMAALPYIMATYGAYKGYDANRQAGASNLNRILGAITGATAGYYGGQMIPGVSTSGFTPFTQTQLGSSFANMFPWAKSANTISKAPVKATPGAGLYRGPAEYGITTRGLTATAPATEEIARGSIMDILTKKKVDGAYTDDYDIVKLATMAGGIPYAMGAFDQAPVDVYQPGYNIAYPEFKEQRGNWKYIDPATGTEKIYEDIYIPESDPKEPYSMIKRRLREGGLAEIKKFNEGGVNYLPSKISHDENDVHNYVRASGYVEDGSGVGDKDEDTMLAQLADGEFVTRADGVLGAGIIAGANPNSMKDMREKGAQYFYEQQRRYKRVFDLLKDRNAQDSKKVN